MPQDHLDVLAIGNAIVDVIADADDAFLDREGLTKGSMRLIDAEEATRLYDHMGPAREISGGSAANSVAGIAMLGGRAGFVGALQKPVKLAVRKLARWYVEPVFADQRAFNAAVLKLVDDLYAENERLRARLSARSE